MGNWGFCKFLHFLSDKSFKKIEKKRGDISKLEVTVTPSSWTADLTKISKEDGGRKRIENAHDTQQYAIEKCHKNKCLFI